MTTPVTKKPERPQRADAQRNRALVLGAAEDLFAEAGNGATIEDIAKRAGVGVGTVCRHFPTKQALLDEVLTESFRELVADADEALASDEPAVAFERFVHRLAAQQARRRMLAESMATELELPPAAVELKSAMRGAITELLGRAQAAGAVRDDISPADTALLFAGVAQVTAVTGADAALRDRYVAVMLDGLRPVRRHAAAGQAAAVPRPRQAAAPPWHLARPRSARPSGESRRPRPPGRRTGPPPFVATVRRHDQAAGGRRAVQTVEFGTKPATSPRCSTWPSPVHADVAVNAREWMAPVHRPTAGRGPRLRGRRINRAGERRGLRVLDHETRRRLRHPVEEAARARSVAASYGAPPGTRPD